MNRKEKSYLAEVYQKLKEKQMLDGDGIETYTTGYKNGHINGQMELLERILHIDSGNRSENEY